MASSGVKRIIENYALFLPVLPALPFVFVLHKVRELFPASADQTINMIYFVLSGLIPIILFETGVSDQIFYDLFNSPYVGRILTGYIFIIFIYATVMPRDEK